MWLDAAARPPCHRALPGSDTASRLLMARSVAIGLERARQVALRHLHVADLSYDTDRSRCQPALPGSDCASRSLMARHIAVGLERARKVALRLLHVADLYRTTPQMIVCQPDCSGRIAQAAL